MQLLIKVYQRGKAEESDDSEEGKNGAREEILLTSRVKNARARKEAIFEVMKSADEIEALRPRCGNLQGRVSGNFKNLVIQIKKAADVLLKQEDEVVVNVEGNMEEYFKISEEIEQLRKEKESLLEKVKDVNKRNGVLRVSNIVNVPIEDEDKVNKLINKVRACRNKVMKAGEFEIQGDSSKILHKDGRSSTRVVVNPDNSGSV